MRVAVMRVDVAVVVAAVDSVSAISEDVPNDTDGEASGDGDGTARSALANDDGNHRDRCRQAGFDGPCDGFRLTARLGINARIGACGIDKCQNRKTEASG